jgi:ATP phosphoribosyltransferase regulatory subunit HisZ
MIKLNDLIKEAGIPKMYIKFLAVSKKVRELEDAQKALSQKYFAEKDLNKKEALLTQLKKGTQTLNGFRRNLADIEEKYVMGLDSDAEFNG